MQQISLTGYYKDKRAIITGASEGIGKDLAIRLAQLGARYSSDCLVMCG